MAFRQLYYTSCEHGLSGYPGYQFNAVSDGVTVEVMRDVERLTAYEPPATLGFAPTEAQIAACPPSLSYAPGRTAILANVVFLGADFSRRFGNYFAHALVTDDPDSDLGGRLPIEAWGAACWTRTASDSPVLPTLKGPVVGDAIERGRVQALLAREAGAVHLPQLLTAVLRAVAGEGRPVVLIGPDAERNAAWIAAVSYLLPASLVRRMSFTTYHRRPRQCGLHLAATTPDGGVLAEASDGLALFDLVAGWSNAGEVHPLARVLTTLGVGGVEDLWADAEALAGPLPDSPDGLLPALTTAMARRRMTLAPPDLRPAVAWFASSAATLEPALVAELGGALLVQPEADEGDLRAVLRAAAGAGVDLRSERLERAERDRVDAEMRRLMAGEPGDARSERAIMSPAARAHAACAVRDRLPLAAAAETAALLRWAASNEVVLDPEDQALGGDRLAGPALSGELPAAELLAVAGLWPDLLPGMLGRLELAAAGDPEPVLRLLATGLGDLVARAGPPHRVGELCAVLEARREHTAANVLGRLVGERRRRGDHAAFDDLLRQLWPHGEWSHADAARAVSVLPAEAASGDLPAWLDRVVARTPAAQERGWYLYLCKQLASSPVLPTLRESTRARVEEARRTTEALDRAGHPDDRGARAVLGLVRGFGDLSDPVREHLLEALPEAMLRLDASRLAFVLESCPRSLLGRLLMEARARLEARRPDPALGAALFLAARWLRRRGVPAADRLEAEVLKPTLPVWAKRHWQEVAWRLAQSDDPAAERAFVEWRERSDRRLGHRLGRASLRSLRGWLARGPHPPWAR